ncbi:ERVV2 protein, partial [Regulus satrapa]|nr:ERVV2 protein [Regulus satrapa]
TAKEGGVCIIINQTCCSYINQEKWVETDIYTIWENTKILHMVAQDDTSWGFTNIWEKLTSWLPNLNWLRQLFATIVGILVLALIILILVKCTLCCFQSTGNSYSNWKKINFARK